MSEVAQSVGLIIYNKEMVRILIKRAKKDIYRPMELLLSPGFDNA
jgi:hypothetical protein